MEVAMEAARTVVLAAKKGDPSWNVFGAELRKLVANPPREALALRAELPGDGLHHPYLTVAFKLEECIVVEDGLIVLAVLNGPSGDAEVKSVDDALEQIAWRKNLVESGDEMVVEALDILVLL
jgi:hypothetical protein